MLLRVKPSDVTVNYDEGSKGALVTVKVRGKEPVMLLLSRAAVGWCSRRQANAGLQGIPKVMAQI